MSSRFLIVVGLFLTTVSIANAQVPVNQSITLSPGWSVVSTPMMLESHQFSAAETSQNFDIYVLDASMPTGWATMSDLGQTEFEPLYGYFIQNKTGSIQTLTLNYNSAVPPNQKLFERTFTAEGWYSFGIANAEYAKAQSADRVDTNNPSSILSLLTGKYDLVIDFTNDEYSSDRKSVSLSDPWKAVVPADINDLNDFRNTKGYAVYIKQSGSRYNGFQNDPVEEITIPEELVFSLGSGSPDATTIVVDGDAETNDVTIMEYLIEAQNGDVGLEELVVNIQTENENLENVIEEVMIMIDNTNYQASTTGINALTADFTFSLNDNVIVSEGESLAVEVIVDFKAQENNYANGEKIKAQVTADLVKETIATGLNGPLNEGQLSGSAVGDEHTLVAKGILVPVDSFASEVNTLGQNDTIGEFTLEFEVTAIEGDYYITDNTSQSSTSPSDGITYNVEGVVGSGLITAAFSSTADEDTSGIYTVREGETETFTLTVVVDPQSTGAFRAGLFSLWYSENSDGLSGTEYLFLPLTDFRTSLQSVQG